MYTKNVGNLDRFIRFLIASGLIIWGIQAVSYFWVVIGIYFIVTALTGKCLLYSAAGVSTIPILSERKHEDIRYHRDNR